MRYRYNDEIYKDYRVPGDDDSISSLLYDLEDNKEIEVKTIKVYNVKGSDVYCTDDEIDEFLEILTDYEIIEELKGFE